MEKIENTHIQANIARNFEFAYKPFCRDYMNMNEKDGNNKELRSLILLHLT